MSTVTLDPAAAAPPAPRRVSRITGSASFFPLIVLFGLNMADEFDRTAFGVLLPEIRDHFRLDLAGVLALEALAALGFLLLSVPLGHLADRSNRVRMATVGGAGWGIFAVLTGLAPAVAVLALARVGSGLGRSVVEPTHNSLIADYYGIEVRTKVYGFHRAANYVGRCLGPLLAGILAYLFGWRTPFIVFGIPTLIFVMLSLRMREPRRGVHEREAAGAGFEVATTDEVPPTFNEAARTLWQVRSLRRIWFALPFFAASLIGFASIISIYYDEEFGLGEAERGFLVAGTEAAAVLGLLVGIPLATRLARRDPGVLLRFLGVVACAIGAAFVLLSISPNLPMAVAMNALIVSGGALLTPAVYAR